jgi:homoserine O-acetyltransferase
MTTWSWLSIDSVTEGLGVNPPETGVMERELKRIKNARLFLIPASEETRGHFTAAFAKFWKQQVQDLLETAPRRGS